MARTKKVGVATDGAVTNAQGSADHSLSTLDQPLPSTLAEIAVQIRAEHDLTLTTFKQGMVHALRVGELLNAARRQIRHGLWTQWLTDNCPSIEVHTAQVYMRLAKHRAEIEAKVTQVSHLTINGALKLLASDEPETRTIKVVVEEETVKFKPVYVNPEPSPEPQTPRIQFDRREDINPFYQNERPDDRVEIIPPEDDPPDLPDVNPNDPEGPTNPPNQLTVRERYQRSLIGDCLVAVEEMTKKTRARFFEQLKEKSLVDDNTVEWWTQESKVIAAQMAKNMTIKTIGELCAVAIDLTKAAQAQKADGASEH
jgi:hypothetical protein